MPNSFTAKKKMFEMFKWTLKKNLSIIVVYSILLVLSLPVIQLLVGINLEASGRTMDELAPVLAGFLTMGCVLLFSIIFTLVNFHYLHVKRQEDLFESLPMSKKQLFLSKYFATIIETIVPAFAVMMLGGIISSNWGEFIWILRIIVYMILGVVANVTLLAMLCLLCGNTVYVIITHILVNMALPALLLIVTIYPVRVLPTYATGAFSPNFYAAFTPLFSPFLCLADKVFSLKIHMLCQVAIIAVAFIVSMKYVARRKSENAETKGMLNALEYIITLVISTTAAFVGGMFFSVMLFSSRKTFIINYCIGAVIVAVVAALVLRLIFQKSIGKARSLVSIMAVSVVLAVGYIMSISYDITSYVDNVPDASEVEYITCNDASYSWDDSNYNSSDEYEGKVTDKKVIKNVIKSHKEIVKQSKDMNKGFYSWRWEDFFNTSGDYSVTIQYHLKNGTVIKRSIFVEETENFALSQAVSEKFVEKYEGKIIAVREGGLEAYRGLKLNKNEKAEFFKKIKKAVKADIQEHGLLTERKGLFFTLGIEVNDGVFDLCMSGDSERTKAVLREYGIKTIGRKQIKSDYSFNNNKKFAKFDKVPVTINLPEGWVSNDNLYVDLVNATELTESDGYDELYTPNGYKDSKCIAQKISDRTYKIMMPIPDKAHKNYRVIIYKENDGIVLDTGCLGVFKKDKDKSVEINVKKLLTVRQNEQQDDTYGYHYYKYSYSGK